MMMLIFPNLIPEAPFVRHDYVPLQVVHFLPRVLFINRIGRTLYLSQFEASSEMQLCPTDCPQLFRWQSNVRNELLKVCKTLYIYIYTLSASQMEITV
jgi:hypothetical protein